MIIIIVIIIIIRIIIIIMIMAQLVCCLTHMLRSCGSIPSHGSLLFAFISMCYYMIYFIYGCGKLG